MVAGGTKEEELFYDTLAERFPCLGDVTYPESSDEHVGENAAALEEQPPGCLVWAADVWQSKLPLEVYSQYMYTQGTRDALMPVAMMC